MSERIAIFGGTFDPPHNGHVATVSGLQRAGYRVLVVPSTGHEFKPGSWVTYPRRKYLARLAFGDAMIPVEDHVDREDQRRALLVLRRVRELHPDAEISFAIGPDIDPSCWTGYDEIVAERFGFVRVPEHGDNLRSTKIREHLEAGRHTVLERMLPPDVFEAIVNEPPSARPSPVHVGDAPRDKPDPATLRAGWTDRGI